MVVQGGDAHSCHLRQVFDPYRTSIVAAEPPDSSCRTVTLVARGGDGTQAPSQGRAGGRVRLEWGNVFSCKEFPDQRHFEFQHQGQTRLGLTGLHHAGHDGRVNGRHHVPGFVVNKSGCAKVNLFPALGHHDQTGLIG